MCSTAKEMSTVPRFELISCQVADEACILVTDGTFAVPPHKSSFLLVGFRGQKPQAYIVQRTWYADTARLSARPCELSYLWDLRHVQGAAYVKRDYQVTIWFILMYCIYTREGRQDLGTSPWVEVRIGEL